MRITFEFWLKNFWLWVSFGLLWKRGPTVEYLQPFPNDFTQTFDDNGVLSSWNWVLATVQMPALMPSGLPLRAQAFKEINPAHSNYPTSLTPCDSPTILFLSFEQYWNEIIWCHISANVTKKWLHWWEWVVRHRLETNWNTVGWVQLRLNHQGVEAI